jgi:hypothetical protein
MLKPHRIHSKTELFIDQSDPDPLEGTAILPIISNAESKYSVRIMILVPCTPGVLK